MGEGRHFTHQNTEPRAKPNCRIPSLLWLWTPDFRAGSSSTTTLRASNKAVAACYKNLGFGLCSTVLRKYFSSEAVISFEKPFPHTSLPFPFLLRNNHITSSKNFFYSSALLYRTRYFSYWCHSPIDSGLCKGKNFPFSPLCLETSDDSC